MLDRSPRVLAALLPLLLLPLACSESPSEPKIGPPSAIAPVSGSQQSGVVGSVLPAPIVVKVTDAKGNGVPNTVVTFAVAGGGGDIQPRTDTTDANGQAQALWTLGTDATAAQRLQARVTGVAAAAELTAVATPGPPTLVDKITLDAACLVPGSARDLTVRVADQYGNAIAGQSVVWTVTSGNGTIVPTTPTTGQDGRASAKWTAGDAQGEQAVSASAGGIQTRFASAPATARTVDAGTQLVLAGTGAICNDIAASGRYLISVFNISPTLATAGFELRGSATAAAASVANAPTQPATARALAAGSGGELGRLVRETYERAEARERIMRQNVLAMARAPRVTESQRAAMRRDLAMSARMMAAVGDTLSVKVPNVFALSCNASGTKATIKARVVYEGTRAIVLEDVAAPLSGQSDSLYIKMGEEMDNVMWPILTQNFGNPLAYDASLDANGKIYMVFSPQVNDMNGVAGFVVSTDFIPPQVCTPSNNGEYFYARVPTNAASGYGSGEVDPNTRLNWFRRTRTVLIHEVKHLVSFAHRFARTNGSPTSADFEESWLEESSAMLAEELWARTIFGYGPNENVGYRQSLFCEWRPANGDAPECANKPLSMADHFIFFHDYLVSNEQRSPFGSTSSGDATFYGSGWAFLRWITDHYSNGDEAAFLRGLTQSTFRGGANVESRTGKLLADLLADWAVAMATDDRTGFTPARIQHTIPGWNIPDIFSGLAIDGQQLCGGCFAADPLARRNVTFGTFSGSVGALRGGSSAVFEVSGAAAARQVLELRGPGGGTPSSNLRLSIVRIE